MIRILGLALMLLTAAGPAAPGTSSCTPGPYIVFFDHGDAHLDLAAREVLDMSVANMGNCGWGTTYLAGHADTSEPEAISRKRVDVVREYLAARGTPRSDIVARARGSRDLRIRTARGVQERQNRRVEIIYGPPH